MHVVVDHIHLGEIGNKDAAVQCAKWLDVHLLDQKSACTVCVDSVASSPDPAVTNDDGLHGAWGIRMDDGLNPGPTSRGEKVPIEIQGDIVRLDPNHCSSSKRDVLCHYVVSGLCDGRGLEDRDAPLVGPEYPEWQSRQPDQDENRFPHCSPPSQVQLP